MMMDDYQNNAAFQHGAIIARPDGKGKFRNAGNRSLNIILSPTRVASRHPSR